MNENLYILPEVLTPNEANEKARPGENSEARAKRVAELAASIRANGQGYPVLVVEVNDTAEDGSELIRYEYVDGGGRVDAITKLNEDRVTVLELLYPIKVWCSIVEPSADLFQKAVTNNLHRTQNSVLEMGAIIREAKERNGWKGHGANRRVAAYLGITETRISEYLKVLGASGEMKAKIESGTLDTLKAALAIMSEPPEERERIVLRSAELAEEEEAVVRKEKRGKKEKLIGEAIAEGLNGPLAALPDEIFQQEPFMPALDEVAAESEPDHEPEPEPAKPSKIKVKHVEQAAREIKGQSAPKSKADILEFFSAVTPAAYPKKAVAFSTYFCETWAAGKGKDAEARRLFDTAVGVRGASGAAVKPAKATKAKKVAAAAKKAPAKKAKKAKK